MSNFSDQKFDSSPRTSKGAIGILAMLAARGLQWLQCGLPQSCALCVAPCGNMLLCEQCLATLPRTVTACPLCGLPSITTDICGPCLARAPPFAATIAAWTYAFPVDQLLQAFKYGGALALAEPFADELTRAVRRRADSQPDGIIALPLSPTRQRQRGFNQAHEIARRVAVQLDIPMLRGLVRIRDSPPQATLAWKARAHNVRQAFEADASVRDRRIAIVDDVMTTGATLTAAAAAARRAGAVAVEAWVVARTLPPA